MHDQGRSCAAGSQTSRCTGEGHRNRSHAVRVRGVAERSPLPSKAPVSPIPAPPWFGQDAAHPGDPEGAGRPRPHHLVGQVVPSVGTFRSTRYAFTAAVNAYLVDQKVPTDGTP